MADDIQTDAAQTFPGKSEDTKAERKHYRPDAPDADIESRGGVGQAGRGATGPDAPLHQLKGARLSGRPNRGSRSPGIGYLYVLVAMFMIIGAGTLLSGGFVPVDPNGPGGPPTLDPYFNVADYGEQKMIYPSNINRAADKNLQLKTFRVNTCGQKTALSFLIDTSGSMQYDGKSGKEKAALKAITKKLTNKSVISIHTFSKNAKVVIPLSYYGDVKGDVEKEIEGLDADGWTTTRDGFSLVKRDITEAIVGNKYPGYTYAVILLTDGVPEQPEPRTCFPSDDFQPYDPQYTANRCFSIEQDPRTPTNLPADLKGMGVKIYSVGIFSQTTTDKQFYPYLSAMLKEIASDQDKYYESIEGGALEKILNEVLNQICEEQGALGGPPTSRANPVGGLPNNQPQNYTPLPNPDSSARQSCGIAHPLLKTGQDAGGCCVQDGPVNNPNECCSGVPYCDLTTNPPKGVGNISCACSGNGQGGQAIGGPNGGSSFAGSCTESKYWCDAKPIIYLYPTVPTLVDVKVTVPGSIPVSIPLYPDGGWKDVLAFPDGTLHYQGKTYPELFYEAAITPSDEPETGFVVAAKDLTSTLTMMTTRLGLNKKEQQDFLNYWVPKLQELKKPYYKLSVFSPEQKQIIDKVDIYPQPTTFIEFIMYYKGLDNPIPVKPLELPKEIPQRLGFTAVEWGGIIDY